MNDVFNIKYITPILGYLGVMLFVEIVEYLIISFYIFDFDYNRVFSLMNGNQEITGIIAALIMIIILYKRRNLNGMKVEKDITFLYINIPFLGIVTCIATSSIISLLMPAVTVTENGGFLPLTILAIGICMPIAEEMVFRGLVYERMRTVLGASTSAFISAILFSLLHYGNRVQVMYALAFGLVAVFVYETYDRNVMSCIILHISANMTAIVVDYTGFDAGKTKVIVTAITMIILMIILLFIISLFGKGVTNIKESDKGKEFNQTWQRKKKI